jgi:hypothetical protein
MRTGDNLGRVQWAKWTAWAALVAGIVLALALVGPPGQAFRDSAAFGSCFADLEGRSLLFDLESGEPTAEAIACAELCDVEPNRMVLLGRWVYLRTAYDGGAACGGIDDADPDLADIFLP